MADFDVAAAGLSVPPPSASITPYRPAISVKNNGIHAALAFGSLRIYKAGALVFSSEVFSATIPAGETRLAQAEKYWTPDTVGTYNVQGYVSCANDQVEPNNNLSPVTVIVGSTPPPPPPIVTAHASQHEEGALDEISIDGLSGKAKDKQEAFDHRSNHEAAGSDELDVSLLKGELADPQTPIDHDNDHHSVDFTTFSETIDAIGTHNDDDSAHAAAIAVHNSSNDVHPQIRGTDHPTLVTPFIVTGTGVSTKFAREDHVHAGPGSATRLFGSETFLPGAAVPMVSVKLHPAVQVAPSDRVLSSNGLCMSLSITGLYKATSLAGSTLSLWLAWYDEVSQRAATAILDIPFRLEPTLRLFRLDANLSFYDTFAGSAVDILWKVAACLSGNAAPATIFLRYDPGIEFAPAPDKSTIEVWCNTNRPDSEISDVYGHIISHGYGAMEFPVP
jgi:hypothetical protein